MSRRTLKLAGGLAWVTPCFCAVCAGPRGPVVDRRPPEAEHWIQDARLREVMHSLEREQMTLWPQEIQGERSAGEPPAAKFDAAAAAADDLAHTADRIGQALTGVDIPEVDRRSFLALAQTLSDQARQLQKAAEHRALDRMRERAAAIDATCDSCHRRFRDLAGPRS